VFALPVIFLYNFVLIVNIPLMWLPALNVKMVTILMVVFVPLAPMLSSIVSSALMGLCVANAPMVIFGMVRSVQNAVV